MFMREDVRLYSTKKYEEYKEEDLSTLLAGTGLEARMDQELAETRKRPSRARQQASLVQDEPRRSLRLAKKKVTMGEEQDSHNPDHLPYCSGAGARGKVEGAPVRTRGQRRGRLGVVCLAHNLDGNEHRPGSVGGETLFEGAHQITIYLVKLSCTLCIFVCM